MYSVRDAVQTLLDRGLTKYTIAEALDTSTTMITRYHTGVVKAVGLKMATRFFNVYQMQIMPHSMEDLTGLSKKEKKDV